MTPNRLIIVRHQAPLRTVGDNEVLTGLSDDQHRLPRTEILVDSRVLDEAVEGGHWRSSDEFIWSSQDLVDKR
jgi:hypothetical protein